MFIHSEIFHWYRRYYPYFNKNGQIDKNQMIERCKEKFPKTTQVAVEVGNFFVDKYLQEERSETLITKRND